MRTRAAQPRTKMCAVLIHSWDAGSEAEWRTFVQSNGFGQLVAAGRGRDVPVIVPTQFVVQGDEVLVHLARPNPIWTALAENANVVLSVAGDWAFIPSSWKVIGDEDPRLGIPTTYYAGVQLVGTATVFDEPDGVAAVLREQLSALQPDIAAVDPSEHGARLRAIRGIRIAVREVHAKFKYGGNVDVAHRLAVIEHLEQRDGPGDRAAAGHTRRRLAAEAQPD
jgi:transcriptional regulator